MKKIWSILRLLINIIVILIIIVGCYIGYVFLSYYRVEDNIKLEVVNNNDNKMETDKEYSIMSYNIGFGAYSYDYSFFMDGGKYSRAYSKEEVLKNMDSITKTITDADADIILTEEVDTKSTRAYKVNEYEILKDSLKDYSNVFAQNYDSPYLFYPVTSPHGKSVSGLATFTKFNITSSIRRSLPIETNFRKILDYDRAYSKVRIPTENGNELVVYTTHLSAYTETGSIATDQLKMIISDMEEEYQKGNYVICGGDFNKDLLGDTSKYTGIKEPEDYSWTKPFDNTLLKDTDISLVAPFDKENKVATCRDAGYPMSDTVFTVVIDGFLVSSNVDVISSSVIDTNYNASDHNPVKMEFKLINEKKKHKLLFYFNNHSYTSLVYARY